MLLNSSNRLPKKVVLCALIAMLMPFSATATNTTTGIVDSLLTSNTISVEESRAKILSLFSDASQRPVYLSQLSTLYAARDMKPIWTERGVIRNFEQQLAILAISGVQPQFAKWIKMLNRADMSAMEKDVVLSDAMLGYLNFISTVSAQGHIWLYSDTPYKLAPPPGNLIAQWQGMISEGKADEFISSLLPQHPAYLPMYRAMQKQLAVTSTWPKLNSQQSLRPNELSDDIPALRKILQQLDLLKATTETASESEGPLTRVANFLSGESEQNVAEHQPQSDSIAVSQGYKVRNHSELLQTLHDNSYTPDLVDAVKRFQEWQGLTPDGVIGQQTRMWLNVSPAQRASLMALNIQRLRLIPDDKRDGIMVNIPAFSLSWYAGGKEILSSRVVVGRADRKTPLMRSALNNVVLNPPWNVPTSLVRKDIIPKMKRDPGWLRAHGYTILSDWSSEAEVIDPATIDWSFMTPAAFPYRLRQAPGKLNSLGYYKFNMPSSDAIYLHDTPARTLFNKDMRALSSGCVRVSKAAELAQMLLKRSGWEKDRIEKAIAEGSTRHIPVGQRIPVSLYYLTAWADTAEQPRYRTDIYNYDKAAFSGVSSQAEARKWLLSD